jgi:adenylyltransferase/sulfurtransferase
LDNREARVFVNSASARVSRPWIDGGIEVLQGVVRGFAPPETACYECTMSQVDWDLLNKRRSCSLLARRALAQRGTPTAPTTASVIGGLQVQEAVKLLHGLETLLGRGFVFDGRHHNSYLVTYPVSSDCPWHEPPAALVALRQLNSASPLREACDYAKAQLGGLEALDLSRELVEWLRCPACGTTEQVFKPAERLSPEEVLCRRCGTERVPSFFHSLSPASELLAFTARELGLPAWDIVWARCGDKTLGLELAGDSPFLDPSF